MVTVLHDGIFPFIVHSQHRTMNFHQIMPTWHEFIVKHELPCPKRTRKIPKQPALQNR